MTSSTKTAIFGGPIFLHTLPWRQQPSANLIMSFISTVISLSLSFSIVISSANGLVDERATAETRNLFNTLRRNAASGKSLVGMDSSTRFGEFLREGPCGALKSDRATGAMTDVKAVCQQNPGIYGIDAAYIVGDFFISRENGNKETVDQSRRQVRQHMQEIYSRGGIVTIHYHMDNPIDGSDYSNGPKELWQIASRKSCYRNSVLKGMSRCGNAHLTYRMKIDRLVSFLETVSVNGVTVPVIFRPFHENNGDWFWWSPPKKNRDAYHVALRTVWEWTVDYVHNEKNHHAMLWAYAPAGGRKGGLTTSNFFDLAPKRSQFDVMGYDRYGDFGGKAADGIREVRAIVTLAERYGKVPAVTEIGHNYQGKRDLWPPQVWSKHTLGPVKDDPVAKRVAWMMMWFNNPQGNSCNGQYFGPHANHKNAIDFKKVCRRKDIILEGDIPFYK